MITAVPTETPVTTPVVEPTVATPVLLLVQMPPEVASVKVDVEPTQTEVNPDITAGSGLTVKSVEDEGVEIPLLTHNTRQRK